MPKRYVVQVVASVSAISTSAVQRGHKPMIKAIGPRTSIATSNPAHTFGYGSPRAANEATTREKWRSLSMPVGRSSAATSMRPSSRAASSLRLSTSPLPFAHVEGRGFALPPGYRACNLERWPVAFTGWQHASRKEALPRRCGRKHCREGVRVDDQGRLFEIAIDKMKQGLCFFDS